MKTQLMKKISLISNLRRNFSFSEALKILGVLKNEKEKIELSNNTEIYLRKGTKDHETFEEVFLDHIYNLNLPFHPRTIIDGGANIGLASLFFKMKYPDVSVVLIEIDKNNLEMIQKNLKHQNKITILNKALYNTNAFFKVFDPFNATNSFVVEESTPDDYDVESVTIDQIINNQNWTEIDILKIDIEGAEKKLFESNYYLPLPMEELWCITTQNYYLKIHKNIRLPCLYNCLN